MGKPIPYDRSAELARPAAVGAIHESPAYARNSDGRFVNRPYGESAMIVHPAAVGEGRAPPGDTKRRMTFHSHSPYIFVLLFFGSFFLFSHEEKKEQKR